MTERIAAVQLCGYDVHGIGDRAFEPIGRRRRACRDRAEFVARDWDDDFDLFLCPRHARAVAQLHDVEPERLSGA